MEPPSEHLRPGVGVAARGPPGGPPLAVKPTATAKQRDGPLLNVNDTSLAADQGQAGTGAGTGTGGAGQAATSGNTTAQSADASVWNSQWNIFAPVSVFSPGAASGPMNQSNVATNDATAINVNDTTLAAGQGLAGSGSASSSEQQAMVPNGTRQLADGRVINYQATSTPRCRSGTWGWRAR